MYGISPGSFLTSSKFLSRVILCECMLTIRRYEKRDFADYAATLEKTTSWRKEAGKELEARMEKMTKREQTWVAEIDSKAVGFMILAPNDDGSLEVDWLDVHPNFQRKGIGTLLVEKAAKVAKAKKIETLSVHTHVANKGMIAFLVKSGFDMHEKIENFYGREKDALRFKKICKSTKMRMHD